MWIIILDNFVINMFNFTRTRILCVHVIEKTWNLLQWDVLKESIIDFSNSNGDDNSNTGSRSSIINSTLQQHIITCIRIYTLLCVNVFYSVFMLDVLLAYFLWSVNINCLKSLWINVPKITRLSQNINIKFTATFVMVGRGGAEITWYGAEEHPQSSGGGILIR
jgi:hypothetical protein